MMSTTTKVLLGILGFVLLITLLIGYRVIFSTKTSNSQSSLTSTNTNLSAQSKSLPDFSATPSASTDERIKNLEYALGNLVTQVKSGSVSLGSQNSTSTSTSTENRLKAIEVAIVDLQTRIKALESNKVTTATTSTKSDSFIPLNWTGTTTSSDWTNITSQVISINPADYSGYKSMKFEVQIKLDGSGGKGYARLFNQDDNTAITLSEASADQSTPTWVSSGAFTLPSSRKSYYLQVKSTSNYQTIVQNAQIRVSY